MPILLCYIHTYIHTYQAIAICKSRLQSLEGSREKILREIEATDQEVRTLIGDAEKAMQLRDGALAALEKVCMHVYVCVCMWIGDAEKAMQLRDDALAALEKVCMYVCVGVCMWVGDAKKARRLKDTCIHAYIHTYRPEKKSLH